MIELAGQVCKWMLCVPRLSPLSPRFEYYADNWNILDKIERFTANGEFATYTKDCPTFSGEELRAALDYIARKQQKREESRTHIKPMENRPRQRAAR